MNLLQRNAGSPSKEATGWKSKVLLFGALGGTMLGVLAGYMYSRAAEEDVSRLGRADRISTGEVLGLGLALLGVIRQVTEMGKGPDRPSKS